MQFVLPTPLTIWFIGMSLFWTVSEPFLKNIPEGKGKASEPEFLLLWCIWVCECCECCWVSWLTAQLWEVKLDCISLQSKYKLFPINSDTSLCLWWVHRAKFRQGAKIYLLKSSISLQLPFHSHTPLPQMVRGPIQITGGGGATTCVCPYMFYYCSLTYR